MAAGTFTMYYEFAKNVRRFNSFDSPYYPLMFALSSNWSYNKASFRGWPWLHGYVSPDHTQGVIQNATGEIVQSGSVWSVKVPPVTWLEDVHQDSPLLAYSVQVWQRVNSSSRKPIGFIDITADGGTTGLDIRARPITLTFPSNVLFTAKVTHG